MVLGNELSELSLPSVRYLDVWRREHLGIGKANNTSKPNGDATLSGVYLKVSSSYMTRHTAADRKQKQTDIRIHLSAGWWHSGGRGRPVSVRHNLICLNY